MHSKHLLGTVAVFITYVGMTTAIALAGDPVPPAVGAPLFTNDPCTNISAIVTRPTVTTSVCTVRPDHVLLETGYSTSTSSGSTTISFPQAYLRIGTEFKRLEVDLSMPNEQRIHSAAGTTIGQSDAGAGVKYLLGASPRYSHSISTSTTIPTGSAGFTAGVSTQANSYNFAYALSPMFSLSGATSFNTIASNGVRYGSFVPSLFLSASLPAATSIFLEDAKFTHATKPSGPTLTQYLGGITRAINQHIQIDAEYGFSPTKTTGIYHFIGFGVSLYK